jgi:hypothetical protein
MAIFVSLLFLTVVAVLGKMTYTYLHQEQEKVIKPKDKYDEAWNEVFRKRQNKSGLNMRLEAIFKLTNSSSISLGLGLLSCATLIFYFNEFLAVLISRVETFAATTGLLLISCVGSFTAITGLFIGMYGAVQVRNESSLIRYGGLLLNIVGLMNLLYFGRFLLLFFVLLIYKNY